jgi:hypothetical protein
MKIVFSPFLFSLSFLFLFFPKSYATEIHFSANKTTGTTDDTFQVHLSVDGDIDGGQVGIEGLEDFQVVGKQSSSRVQIINGSATHLQETILSLSPKSSGNFSLTAFAKNKGKEIESDTLLFKVKKSLAQETREKLLKVSDQKEEKAKSSLKEILKEKKSNNNYTSPQTEKENQIKNASLQLKAPPIKKMPKVEHISAFNTIFWGQFLLLLFFMCLIFAGIFFMLKKQKK